MNLSDTCKTCVELALKASEERSQTPMSAPGPLGRCAGPGPCGLCIHS